MNPTPSTCLALTALLLATPCMAQEASGLVNTPGLE